MTRDERMVFRLARHTFQSTCGPVQYPKFRQVLQTSWIQMGTNLLNRAGVNPGLILTGLPNSGKSWLGREIGRAHELRMRRLSPHAAAGVTPEGYDYRPVVFLTLDGTIHLRPFLGNAVRAYGHELPVLRLPDIGVLSPLLVDYIRCCRTSMIIVDDADRLKIGAATDLTITDQLKTIAEHSGVTFVFLGKDMDDGCLLNESQFVNRFPRIELERFGLAGGGRAAWQNILRSFEKRLLLVNAEPGDLSVALEEYIHDASDGGLLGIASYMVMNAAQNAMLSGVERITRDVMDMIDRPTAGEEPARRGDSRAMPIDPQVAASNELTPLAATRRAPGKRGFGPGSHTREARPTGVVRARS
jgi:hypothetical protein